MKSKTIQLIEQMLESLDQERLELVYSVVYHLYVEDKKGDRSSN